MAKTKGTTNIYSPSRIKGKGRYKKKRNKHNDQKKYVGQGRN